MRGLENARPLRSASLNLSSTGTGVNTAFSGFGFTPTGELDNQNQHFCLERSSIKVQWDDPSTGK